jgi:hypothetical protein
MVRWAMRVVGLVVLMLLNATAAIAAGSGRSVVGLARSDNPGLR